MPQATRQTKETKEEQNGTKTPLLEPDTDTEGDELDFGQVGFHCTLDKQMPRKAIAEGYLGIKPAVRVAAEPARSRSYL